MKRMVLLIGLAGLAAVLVGGCTTAIREGVGAVRGAKGAVVPIQPLAMHENERPLGGYTRFVLGTFADGTNGRTPQQILNLLPAEFEKQLIKNKLGGLSGGKTLELRGTVLHYEGEGLLGAILGPLEEVVVRVDMVDKATGRTLGTANCIGRTTTRVNKGIATKAEGLAKALVAWIDKRYPDR